MAADSQSGRNVVVAVDAVAIRALMTVILREEAAEMLQLLQKTQMLQGFWAD
jgi:hypothetical protein